jgi:hypothetical protein
MALTDMAVTAAEKRARERKYSARAESDSILVLQASLAVNRASGRERPERIARLH